MKRILGFLAVISALNSCAQSTHDIFPDSIRCAKTDKHIRIEGTKIFGIIPQDFQYIKELARYQKNDKLYIQFIESNMSSFIQVKPTFTKEAMEAKGAKIDIIKNLKLNNFDAVYAEGPSKNDGDTKIVLTFGDDSFVVIIAGVCKTNDIEGKKELQNILNSIYYDKTLEINPLELANFEFDQTITSFKYAMTASNFFIYTEKGKEDVQNPTANMIQLGALPKMTEVEAVSFFNGVLSDFESYGVTLDSKNFDKIKINDYKVIKLETNIKSGNHIGILYEVFIVGENSCVLFTGTAYDNLDEYLIKYKKTVESIIVK